MSGYKYQGTRGVMSDAEVKARVETARAKAAGNGAPQEPGRDAEPSARAVPGIKGAVKVARFPHVSQYPFRQIANDGGIWKLDPAAFTWRGKPVAPASIRAAAMNWGSKEGYSVKTVLHYGVVYVQFTRRQP